MTIAVLTCAGPASARSYTVGSCNSAQAFGFNASAWEPYSNAGQHLRDLPDERRFHGRREQPDDRSAVRRLQLLRPRLHRAAGHDDHRGPLGRPARPQQLHMGHLHARRAERSNRPRPAETASTATRPTSTSATTRSPTPPPPAQPASNNWSSAEPRTCSPGAAMHSHVLEVTIDDPQPPSISLSGRMVSGQWVSGTAGNSPDLDVDRVGQQRDPEQSKRRSRRSTRAQSYGCNWSLAAALPRPAPR